MRMQAMECISAYVLSLDAGAGGGAGEDVKKFAAHARKGEFLFHRRTVRQHGLQVLFRILQVPARAQQSFGILEAADVQVFQTLRAQRGRKDGPAEGRSLDGLGPEPSALP